MYCPLLEDADMPENRVLTGSFTSSQFNKMTLVKNEEAHTSGLYIIISRLF